MLADLYPMRRKLKNFWMHPNENLCRSLDLFGQDVYHNRTMLPPRETMLGSNLCKRTLQRCLCTNLPQFRRYSGRPNIYGVLIDNFAGSFASATKGAFSYKVTGAQNLGFNANTGSGGYFEFEFFASRNNSMYGSSLTNQPAALRSLVLVRAY